MNDVAPDSQVGMSGAILSVAGVLGIMGGFAFADVFVRSGATSTFYWFVVATVCLLCIPYIFLTEDPLKQKIDQISLMDKAKRIFTDPAERDWLKVCLLHSSRTAEDAFASYKIFFVRDFLHVAASPEMQKNLVATNIMLSTGIAVVLTILIGHYTDFGDSLARRKNSIYCWSLLNSIGYCCRFD